MNTQQMVTLRSILSRAYIEANSSSDLSGRCAEGIDIIDEALEKEVKSRPDWHLLATNIMADCGISSLNNRRVYDRVFKRILDATEVS